MLSKLEKGGFPSDGINLALCENPLPPLDEAINAAKKELRFCNHYTEPHSWKLLEKISNYVNLPIKNIHINAGSELILRQIFSMYGKKVHLITPTYYLFEEISKNKSYTKLQEKNKFIFDMKDLEIPDDTTLAVIINPNNPTGGLFEIKDNVDLVRDHPNTIFLIDEAFIEFGGKPTSDLVLEYENVVVTRTFSKAFSLAGLRTGYALANEDIIINLNEQNDAYPLGRTAEAAAIASLDNVDKIQQRVKTLKSLAKNLSEELEKLGIITYPSETYFFLIRVPEITADNFVRQLSSRNIHARAITLEGLENNYVRFTTSTPQGNETVLSAVEDILSNY
ncbi:MAG: histidinol-phosphate transaminase [Nitrosopumilaceae archaeon]|jgi:histidinol-phosphate aminotransferase